MEEREIIRRFQARRRRLRLVLKVFVTVFLSGLGLAVAGPNLFDLKVLVGAGFAASAIAMVCFVAFAHFAYRCPRCNDTVETEAGVQSDPEFCPKCGVRLKSELLKEYEQTHTRMRALRLFLPYLAGWLLILVPLGLLLLNGAIVVLGTQTEAEIVSSPLSGASSLELQAADPDTGGIIIGHFHGLAVLFADAEDRGGGITVYLLGESFYPSIPIVVLGIPLGMILLGILILVFYSRFQKRQAERRW